MFVVRFVALIALAVWIGGMIMPIWMSGSVPADLGRQTRTLSYVCGGALLISLFAMKFLGPPPRQFSVRAAVVALMIGLVAAAHLTKSASPAPTIVDIVLSFVLLSWYVRE